MLNSIFELNQKLVTKLTLIDLENSVQLKKAEQSIDCIISCLGEMRKIVCEIGFNNQEEEIFFFKKIKPDVFYQLIYFKKVFNIEVGKPAPSKKAIKKRLKYHQKKINLFYKDNREFCHYMRSGMTHLDIGYFTRGNLSANLLDDSDYYNLDPYFSTIYDFKASCLLANDKLSEYIDIELSSFSKSSGFFNTANSSSLAWTDSKVGIIEVIYALHATGCLNNGKLEIKEIADCFSKVFSIDLGDFYREFQEIKNRKNPTKFLEKLQNSLIQKIEKQDEI